MRQFFYPIKFIYFQKRPAIVKKIFEVNIKRPRDYKVFTSNEFNRIKGEMLHLLLEE